MFSKTFTGYSPSWQDTQVLLKELYRSDEKDKILAKDAEIAQVGGNRNLWARMTLTGTIIF